MDEVEGRHLDLAVTDIVPDVHFGPVAQGKDAEMFALVFATVVEIPEFRSLLLGLPLSKTVAVRKKAFLGARLFFIAARAADGSVKLQLGDSVQQGDRLQHVAAGMRSRFLDSPALVDRVLNVAHDQLGVHLPDEPVAEGQGFREVVPCVDVKQGERDATRPECPPRQVDHHDRVFAPEKRSAGLSNWAATSRRTKMASDSSCSR